MKTSFKVQITFIKGAVLIYDFTSEENRFNFLKDNLTKIKEWKYIDK